MNDFNVQQRSKDTTTAWGTSIAEITSCSPAHRCNWLHEVEFSIRFEWSFALIHMSNLEPGSLKSQIRNFAKVEIVRLIPFKYDPKQGLQLPFWSPRNLKSQIRDFAKVEVVRLIPFEHDPKQKLQPQFWSPRNLKSQIRNFARVEIVSLIPCKYDPKQRLQLQFLSPARP